MKENHSAQEQIYVRAQESYGAKEERKRGYFLPRWKIKA